MRLGNKFNDSKVSFIRLRYEKENKDKIFET